MGMSSADSGGKKGAVPQMNVTPLVDVVLVLLIIFMVVTPLLSKQFWLHLPKKDDTQAVPAQPNNDNLVVTVDRGGAIRVNRTEIAKAEFRDRLARLIAGRSDKTVYFDAENGTPYALAVEAMDLARAAGAKTIAILTDLK